MKKSKDFNNLPERAIPELKKDDVAIFELINLVDDRDNPGRKIIPAAVNVPPKDTVLIDDTVYDIAALRGVGESGDPIFYEIFFVRENLGRIVVRGDNIRDRHLYSYLMLTNHREDKEGRDKDKRPIFKLIEEIKEAQSKRGKRQTVTKAVDFALNMSDEAVKEFVAARGHGTDRDIAVLRDEVESFAENNPGEFMKLAQNRTVKMRAKLTEAWDAKVIKFDRNKKEFRWGSDDSLIARVEATQKAPAIEQLAAHLSASEEGLEIYNSISGLVEMAGE